MHALSGSQLLSVWERGEERDGIERALLLLCAAYPEQTREELAGLSIGLRDAHLFELQQRMFPGALEGFANCPKCEVGLEYPLPAENLWRSAMPSPEQPLLVAAEEFLLRLRLPNSLDLEAARRCSELADARRSVAHRCVLEATRDGEVVAAEQLPERVIVELSARLAEADPQAELLIDLTCPECGHTWEEVFDVGTYLWADVRALAIQILRDIHTLARAYGWREADVLAMSGVRRQLYLDMVD